MITLNDPKLFFTRSKSQSRNTSAARKRRIEERKSRRLRRRSDPRGPFSERERASSCVCVYFSSFFDQNRCRSSPTKSKARGSNSRHDSKKKETTTPPKRNAPPVIDDALHSRRGAAGGVSEHLLSRSGVSKKGTWCSDDDVFDAF